MAAVLKEANCSLPLSLTASVNRNGAVTLTANPYTPASTYSPSFDAMTKKLNQSFPVGALLFLVFREAPTSIELLIHNLPLSMLSEEPTDLFPSLLETISNAIDVPIFGTGFLQSDAAKRAEKRRTSVVVVVDGLHVSRFCDSIRLCSHARMVAPAYSASKSTQCRKRWRFGHSPPLCKEEAQACPICTLLHHRSAHRCANQSCPHGGFEKSVVGCCNASPPLCVNCGGQHASFDGTCPVRHEIHFSLRPPRDQEIPDAPDAGLPQTTPQGLTAPPTVLATPARHGPCFPPSSESTQPETVKLVRSASAQPSRAAPLPPMNIFCASSTLFHASTSADWSEPASTDINMKLYMSTCPAPTQCSSPSQSFHYPGFLNLSIVQHNCLGSTNVFQTIFPFFTLVERLPHIVALQDIPLWKNCPPLGRNYKCFFPPATDSYKPHVTTYVHERLLSVISDLPLFFERGDLMAVNFHSSEGHFDTSHNSFRLYNACSIPSGHTRLVSPLDLFPRYDFPTLVLRDFNIHHSTSDPTRLLSDYD